MTPLAWIVFFTFIVYVVWDGVRRTRDAKDLDGYYAGGRKIPWWAAGLSVMATQASAITVIGTTGQGHEGGMGFLQTYLGLPFAMIVLCLLLIPLLRQMPILTAYEYLERRFGPGTRTLASLIFLVSRCAALGIVIYAPAVVLSAMTGLDQTSTVLIIGALTTFYTCFGGVNAVIWTDVKQMSVILGGLVLVFVILLTRILEHISFGELLDVAGAAGKLNALEVVPESMEFLPRTVTDAENGLGAPSFWEKRYNLWSGLLGGLFLHMAYFGCDQSQAQRILTNASANESRKALLLSAFTKVPMQAFVLFIGVLLWLFHSLEGEPLLYVPDNAAMAAERAVVRDEFQARYDSSLDERREALLALTAADTADAHPAALERYQRAVKTAAGIRSDAARVFSPEAASAVVAAANEGRVLTLEEQIASGRKHDTNYVFPHFILNELDPILLGLILAAIFAAAMSSVDSVLNSLSAATIVDFWIRFVRPEIDDRAKLRAARGATLLWGGLATFAALFFIGGGSIIEQINRVGSFFYGTLLGGFALAILVPRAGALSGLLGLIGGMTSVLVVHNTLKVEFLWYNVIGCVGVLLVGTLASTIEPTKRVV